MEDLRHDLEVVERLDAGIGLQLNCWKTDIICLSSNAMASLLFSLQGARVVFSPGISYLIGDMPCIHF